MEDRVIKRRHKDKCDEERYVYGIDEDDGDAFLERVSY